MKTNKITEDKLPLTKLNHLRLNLEDIERLKKLVYCLDNRRKIMQTDKTELSEFEKNERQILGLKTELELAKTHANIIKKEMYVADHKKILVFYLNEMDENFDVVYKKLTELKDNKDAQDLLSKHDAKAFSENWELAIDFYVRAKALIEPPKETPEDNKLKKVN